MVYLDMAPEAASSFGNVQDEYFGQGYLRRQGFLAGLFHRHKARRRLRLIQQYRPTGRLLDFGCGGGELLVEAQKLGYRVVGFDLSPTVGEYVRQRYRCEVYWGDPTSLECLDPFDVIVLSHVLEHVVDPVTMLQSIRRLIALGGALYLATPNVSCWEAHFAGWASYEPYHCSYFSPSTLKAALEQAGFEVIGCRTWEPLSAWLNVAIRGCFRARYSSVRRAIEQDPQEIYRSRYRIAMALLTLLRLGTGVMLTPLRLLQESLARGEELVCLASPSRPR